MLAANPALLSAQMPRRLALSYTDYLADIALSAVFYTFQTKRYGRWGAGLQYQHYGDFMQTSSNGQASGTFTVHDYAVSLTHATSIEPFTLAATLKFALSGIAEYKASAALVDVGGVYKHPEKEFYVGLALKNIGYQLQTFTGGPRKPLPFDAQLGLTYKPEHMPLRFSVTAHHLQQFDLTYQDTAQAAALNLNQSAAQKNTFSDKLARHLVAGGELLLSKNVQITLGYHYLRRRELRLATRSGGAGLAAGATIRLRAFELHYTRAYYHLAGASNAVTVVTDLPRVFGKKAAAALP